MFLILRSFLDPAVDEFFLFGIQLEKVVGRGHHIVRVLGNDALPDERFLRFSGNDAGP